ncbi:C40 family peptidase [Blautia coccoides]|uniref:NlpC/P60 domain-containing protein n=3 Tax=Lachnospiraceae TaxID=186803 RepID=A0A7G5MXR0_9FIRM|nr:MULTISPECIES: SH3 domain-containing C40 family peptidase [Blautia]MCB5877554.1 C40 family peptidase [Blautia producta]MCB6784802.1 C40 family peptidase [Blautia producta]MCR1987002.1 C40 family peptidase [Blautia coccoides]MDU5220653.1 SH3 domain-containing C40 family peptidase [Blautia producta]MDU5383709.1 SH3 domain-containing C40 family peptidase [Blautia producta]
MRNFMKKISYTLAGTGILLTAVPVMAEPAENVPVEQCCAVADVDTCLNIREGAGTDTAIIGKLPKDGLCYVESTEGEWSYISSGEMTGYVCNLYLDMFGTDEADYMEITGLEEPVLAYPVDDPEPVPVINPLDLRTSLVDYALQFVGNPYVWGGTSLTNGADCSGFVQTLYSDFGVELPRVAADQANAGQRISVEEALPGDLIFYAENGYIYHVVMYIGDGQVVHASSSATGIKVSNLYREQAVWGARFF